MRNLKIFKEREISFEFEIKDQCVDQDHDTIYLLSKDGGIYKCDNGTTSERELVASLNQFDDWSELLRDECVQCFEYLIEDSSFIILLSCGIIFTVSKEEVKHHTLQGIDEPVNSCAVSPKQDRIAVADASHNLFMLDSSDFCCYQDTNARDNVTCANQPVGVGWGSKETQFFGLDGRPEQCESTQNGCPSPLSDNQESSGLSQEGTFIDWRADGQLFASLTLLPHKPGCSLKVWSPNLELMYMNENLLNIRPQSLSWKKSEYITCVQHFNRIDQIAMFEKNGLVRHRIELPSSLRNMRSYDVSWSPDAKILAITSCGNNQRDKGFLLLYTMQNFHYYLKSTISMKCYHLSMLWISSNKFDLFSDACSFAEYICNSSVDFSSQDSSVAVIDANKILITPFKICNVPPPMAPISLTFNELIESLDYHSDSNGKLIVTTTAGNSYLSELSQGEQSHDLPKLDCTINNQRLERIKKSLSDWISFRLPDHSNIILLSQALVLSTSNEDTALLVHFTSMPSNICIKTLTFEFERLVFVARSPDDIVLMFRSGTNCHINLLSPDKPHFLFKFEDKASYGGFIKAEILHIKEKISVLSLDQAYILRLDDRIICNNCSSFAITTEHLVYTTTDDMLNLVLLETMDHQATGSFPTLSHPIETGSTIILLDESDAKVVLQMPRGNLETIHPRLLVISLLASLIADKKYMKAIEQARRHRLSQNFIADYMYRLGACDTEIKDFCSIIANHNPEMLIQFINELEDCDSFSGRYSSYIPFIPRNRRLEGSKETAIKVNAICSCIELSDEPRYTNLRLSTYFKCKPAKIEKVLELIQQLGDGDERRSALKHVLYFITIEKLFDAALGTYDTNIAEMIAASSAKDPKEYLDLLSKFDDIEDQYYRRYKIDLHIKRFSKAFENLFHYHMQSLSEDEDPLTNNRTLESLLEVVISSRLYSNALCFLQDMEERKPKAMRGLMRGLMPAIWERYGLYLKEKRMYLEAYLAYSKGGKQEAAVLCCILADSWIRALRHAHRSNCYLSSYFQHGSIEYFCACRLREAKSDEIPKDKHSLVKIKDVIESLDMKAKVVTNQYNRLKELLGTYQAKRKTEFNTNCGSSDITSTINDAQSDQSSVSGVKSNVSHSSLKTRKSDISVKSRQKMKRVSLKHGSANEDLALLIEVKKFISDQKSDQSLALAASINYFEDFNDLYNRKLCYREAFKMTARLNKIVLLNHELAQEMRSNLWPEFNEGDNPFSVYKRFDQLFMSEKFDNVDFEILIRPDLSKECRKCALVTLI